MRFDISGKAQRVIPRKFFRKFGVALFECFNDRQMFGQRRGDAFGASDRHLPITADMQQDFVGHVDQGGGFAVAREPLDGAPERSDPDQ